MPLYDQDGVQRGSVEVEFPGGLTIARALVEHSSISLFVEGDKEPALMIYRPTHPGAGLGLEIAEWIDGMTS